jgi:ABC-type uncharacterized transport system substrate-binding protein
MNIGKTWSTNKSRVTRTTKKCNILLYTFLSRLDVYNKLTNLHLTTNTWDTTYFNIYSSAHLLVEANTKKNINPYPANVENRVS